MNTYKNRDALNLKVYQRICLLIALSSITGGMLAGYLIEIKEIYYVELFISAYFFSVPLINKVINFYISFTVSYLILCSALIFWGLVLGPSAQIHILVGFLIGLAWYVLKNKYAKWSIACFDLAMLIFLEVCYYNRWLKPVDLPPAVQMYMRWIVIIVGSLLSIAMIYLYYTRWVNEKIERLISDLEKANNFKRLFIFQITHDLRTQLNAIYYIAQLFKREITLDSHLNKIQPYNNLLFTAVNNASLITNNVLDISEIEAGKMEVVENVTFRLKDFLSSILRAQQVTASTRNVKLKLLHDDNLPAAIVSDSFKVKQVLTNLLSNAIKYADKGSTVYLKSRKLSSNLWSIEVVNKGAGIPIERQEAIFEQFVTNRNGYTEGTGLGLYIVKNMINVLNGSIKVESNPGEHTAFTVTLPLLPGSISDIQDEKEGNIDLSNIHVLIADDNEMNNLLFSKYLTYNGCTVTSASNGKEVLEILSNMQLPDVILLDQQMPVMDGAKTLDYIKKDYRLRQIPIIICTGSFENEKMLLSAGAAAVIIKPVDQKTLFKVISQHLPQILS